MTRFPVRFKDEAGFFPHSLASPVVRNLSFGVLIVLVGFVAALPFRKTPPPDSADLDATLATGPSTGLVVTGESGSFGPLSRSGAVGLHRSTAGPWGANQLGMPTAPELPVSRPAVSQSPHPQMAARIPSDAQPSQRRDLRLPLTYDDLAVPLVTPEYVDRRFGAVAKNPQGPVATDALPKSEPGRTEFEPLAMTNAVTTPESDDAPFQRFDTQTPSILSETDTPVVAAKPALSAKRPIEGRLASDTRPASKEAEAVRDERPRHWIRQPSE